MNFPFLQQNSGFSSSAIYIRGVIDERINQMSASNVQNKRRRKKVDGDGEGSNEEKRGAVKTREVKEILTSLLLLEEQDKEEQEELDREDLESRALLEANHRKTNRAMWDYLSYVQKHDSAVEQIEGTRKRKVKGNSSSSAAAAAAAAAAEAAEEQEIDPSGNRTGGGSEKPGSAPPQRRLWVKNRSQDWWDQCNSADFPEEEFKKAFRMGKDTFEMICNELSSVVAKENTMLRDAVPVRQRVAVCIWRLATGEPLRLVSKKFGLGISTCHKLVLEVCTAIKTVLMPKYLQWPDEEKMRNIKDEYEAKSGIKNVVGSMYTTHIPIIAPKISVAAYFNKRHTERNQKTSYSITVQGVVDPKGVFTDVCIGWPGSMPDDQVLEKSALYQRANGGLLNGVWIVGSSGYPLMDWVLVPYAQQNLTWTQHAFNEKIGEIRRVSKDAFARLKGRWACLQKRTEVKLQDLPVVLGACCVLHNICEMRNEVMDPELNFELIDDEMVPEVQLRSASARMARDTIAHNLLHHNHAGFLHSSFSCVVAAINRARNQRAAETETRGLRRRRGEVEARTRGEVAGDEAATGGGGKWRGDDWRRRRAKMGGGGSLNGRGRKLKREVEEEHNQGSRERMAAAAVVLVAVALLGGVESLRRPHRILLDTDVDTDDFFALLYLLKLNRSEFDLKGVTISSNGWTDAGHSVNQIYDLLYMMGRDDIPVGVGGEGGILEDGTILPNVGGYLPIVEQGIGTVGYCRYRQAVPVGLGGRLDIDTNFGFRKSFLPQGRRRYSPLWQPTAQRVLIDTISAGPTTVFITGAHTNLAIFLMSNPHLKKNVEHIYVMGGGVTSQNPTGCCPKNDTSCQPRQCGDRGNLFTDYTSNPFAEFNVFIDPFAAYQVIHSGVPITLVPLDATNTIPITAEFFENFESSQHTYEAQYIFKSLKMARDTWFDDQFYTSYFMWDSFLSGVATSIMSKPQNHEGENDFAEMKYMNITVITSNEPYGVSDGSNPLFDGRKTPKFNLKSEVHSGHIQTGLRDPFCLLKNGKGKCRDGYTTLVEGPEGVPVLVAVRAKPNRDVRSPLDREFFISFLDVINRPQQTGRFNFTTEYPNYKEVLYKPDLRGKQKLGKNVVFDMDMSAGDFLALFYLLKLPVEVINLKAILVSPTGWANAATIDVIYDVLHMMGRDDIPVGLGDVFPVNITDPVMPGVVGDCKYQKVIPHGNGGFIDSDTLYGLARDLPRSPRRYTAENSVKFGAPRDTDHPELRQPLALQVWESVVKSLDPKSKITILTNGPLTNVANIIGAGENVSSAIQEVVVVGGHIKSDSSHKGNVINFPSNKFAELNMFFDPVAAKTVFASKLDVTLIPLATQRKVSSFPKIIQALAQKKTPEAAFAKRLLSRLYHLQMKHHRYQHTGTFVGEILGSVVVAGDVSTLKPTFGIKKIEVSATGVESEDGEMMIDEKQGKAVKVLENVDPLAYYHLYGHMVGNWNQSAVVGSFLEQTRMWSTPLNTKRHYML